MLLRGVFFKNRILSKIKVVWCTNRLFFRNLHEILSGKIILLFFPGPHFDLFGGLKDRKMYSIWDFDQNTNIHLKSSSLSLFQRE